MNHYYKYLQILTFFFLAIAMTMIPSDLFARSNGPALNGLGDRTGSPLSPSTCSQCHGGGSFDPVAVISAVDEFGSPVVNFIAGETYMISVDINPSSGSPAAYGFQLTLLDGMNKTIGTFSTPSVGTGLVNLSNQVIWEHTTPSLSNRFTVLWDAPAVETTVSIYAVGNAVNDNGNTSGDSPSASAFFSADITYPAEWIFVNGFE